MDSLKGEAGLPWNVSGKRVKQDFDFGCLPLDTGILRHINDARADTGLKLIKG